MSIIASFDIGIKNLGLCVIHKNTEKIFYWTVLDISGSSNVISCKRMVQQLDKIDILKNVDTVLVEKQPSVNAKMRVVQGYVSSYFVIRSIDNNKNVKVLDYSPKHKLGCYDGEIPTYNIKSEYNIRKKIGIFHTSKLLEITKQESKFVDLFNNSKKKDDLADCYLQSLSFIRFNDDKLNQLEIGKVVSRKPTKKQDKYKKYSRSNLKYVITENLKLNVQNNENEYTCDLKEFVSKWVDLKEIKKNIISIYTHEYTIENIIKDLVPEQYLDKCFTTNFIKKKKYTKTKKQNDYTINDNE